MDLTLRDRLKHAWNAFNNKDPTPRSYYSYGTVYSNKPDRVQFTRGNERSIIGSIYNKIAIDAAAISIKHVQLDEDGRYLSDMDSELNERLNLSANLDQTGTAFRQDVYESVMDEGVIAVIPTVTDVDPRSTEAYKILAMRTGKIIEWRPHHIMASVYNEDRGIRENVLLPKTMVAIIDNPFYSVMNEPNSTLSRLKHKLVLLDAIDEQSGSGKLDLIIQLPYVVKTEARRKQAEERRKDIEGQLAGSKYGIAYTDGTEHITQLNRPVDNNLMKQVEYLQELLYSQLGITQSVMDGTASAEVMENYYNRTVKPLVQAFVEEMNRKFLTKTARSQKKAIMYFRDPFELMPVDKIADTADKLTRNEIMSSNEVRQKIGLKPSKDPRADELINKNISHPEEEEKKNENSINNEVKIQNDEDQT